VGLGESFGYGLDDEYSCLEILEVINDYENDIPSNSIFFAQDPGGNMFLLICSGADSGVYYCDSSHFYEKSTEKVNAYKLNDTFDGFLKMIVYETES